MMTIESFVSCIGDVMFYVMSCNLPGTCHDWLVTWSYYSLHYIVLHLSLHILYAKLHMYFTILLHDSTWGITQIITWNVTRYCINVINVFTWKASQTLHVLLHGITLLITSLITWHLNCRLHTYCRIHFFRYYMRLYTLYYMLYYMSLLSGYIGYYMPITWWFSTNFTPCVACKFTTVK